MNQRRPPSATREDSALPNILYVINDVKLLNTHCRSNRKNLVPRSTTSELVWARRLPLTVLMHALLRLESSSIDCNLASSH